MTDLTGEFAASFVRPPSLAGTHAVILGVLAAGGVIAIRYRHVVSARLRAEFRTASSPVNLAVLRVVVCLGLAARLCLDQALFFSELPRALMFPPYGTASAVAWVPVSRPVVLLAGRLLELCLVAGALGLCTRTAMLGAFVLGTYVLGVPQLFGKVNHHNHLLSFAALLAASDAGAALSVDAAWRRWRYGSAPPGPSPAFGAPLAVARLLIGLIYFFPGLWKLWLAGPAWFLGDTLETTMLNFWFLGLAPPRPGLLASHAMLVVAGLGILAFELSFVFLILLPRARLLAAVAGLAFHVMTGVALNVWFVPLVLCYAVFVDWSALATRVVGRRSAVRVAPGRTAAPAIGPVLVATSVALALANANAGVRGIVHGWPFACYPIFAPAPEARVQDIDIVTVDGFGREARVDTEGLRRRMGRERWARLVQRIAGIEDERLRAIRAGALLEVWRRGAGVEGDRRRARMYLDTYTTILEEADRNPLARTLLLDAEPLSDQRANM